MFPKYRGKDINTNKWIYGGYMKMITADPATISPLLYSDNSDSTKTGLGLTMYDGDIICSEVDYDSLDGFSKTIRTKYLCEYNEELMAYVFYYIDPDDGVMRDGDIWYWSDFIEDKAAITVVGNKWDNPEMLSGTGKAGDQDEI